jgi:type II secretory pathway predicted ATPase ExeA
MYKNFFGLRENPFNVNPDPRFLHLTSRTQEALNQLTYGIQNRKGFILLTGEVGTGKTTLVNYLLDWLRHQKMSTAFIFNSHLSTDQLFDFILTEFGIPIDSRLRSNMLLGLNQWLIERFRAGDTAVLIVDEAQGLSFELLEEIRLLLNLETAAEKLLQIVLVGQPELEDKLKRPELRQLRQRITLRCHTAPLTLEESCGYIADRLRIGGATGDPIFAYEAMEAVHFYSRGIPRIMNLLCEHALINAYVEQFNPVPAGMVEEAARDFLLDEFPVLGTRSGFRDQMNSNLTVMQSIFAKELIRPFTTEEASLHEPPQATWASAPAAFSVEEPTLTAVMSPVTTRPECSTKSSFVENGAKEDESELCLDSIVGSTESAAQLVAGMKRNPEADASISPLYLVSSRDRNEPAPAADDNQTYGSKKWALTRDFMSRISSRSRRMWIRGLSPSLESWRISRETFPYSAKVLHRWIFEFRRDWIAMINAIGLPEITKSFLQWLRQPIHSNVWRPAKTSPFKARHDLHP